MALDPKLSIGKEAPDFCLPDQNEEEVCLHDYQGKWVVLYFYPKDNTTGCTAEALDFTTHLDDFKAVNTEILGVSPDSPQSHVKFITRKNSNLVS